jgi:hypothetical protein
MQTNVEIKLWRYEFLASALNGDEYSVLHHVCNNTKQSVEKLKACIMLSCLPRVLRFLKTHFSQEPLICVTLYNHINILGIHRLISISVSMQLIINLSGGHSAWSFQYSFFSPHIKSHCFRKT